MTTLTLTVPSPAEALAAKGTCATCRTVQPVAALEVFPSPGGPLVRCADEDACRSRYTPRRLAWSTRWPLPGQEGTL